MSASLTELLTQAIAHERRGDTASARALYERALALSPGHPGALLKLALFAQQAGLAPVAGRHHAPRDDRQPARRAQPD